MKTATKVIILLLATLCIGEIVVSVRLGNQAEEGSLQFNSMGTIRGEGDVELPKIPEGSALQRCRFKCDNLAFLPKDMAGNVSSEHCYLGCLWFSELGCTPLPPAVPHICVLYPGIHRMLFSIPWAYLFHRISWFVRCF